MTRGKWVALAVGSALFAVLFPFLPLGWEAVMYTPECDELEPFKKGVHAVVMRKRVDWIPGPDRVLRCAWCAESDHSQCPRKVGSWAARAMTLDRVACTCPHPSHAQESK